MLRTQRQLYSRGGGGGWRLQPPWNRARWKFRGTNLLLSSNPVERLLFAAATAQDASSNQGHGIACTERRRERVRWGLQGSTADVAARASQVVLNRAPSGGLGRRSPGAAPASEAAVAAHLLEETSAGLAHPSAPRMAQGLRGIHPWTTDCAARPGQAALACPLEHPAGSPKRPLRRRHARDLRSRRHSGKQSFTLLAPPPTVHPLHDF